MKSNKNILYLMNTGDSSILIPNYFLTTGEQKWLLRTIFNVMKKFPDYKLIIKGRSSDDLNDINLLPDFIAKQEGFTNYKFVREVKDPNKLLNNADLILFQNTGMILKALKIEKPVIALEFKHLKYNSIFANKKAITMVYDEKGLYNAVDKVIGKKVILINKENKNGRKK